MKRVFQVIWQGTFRMHYNSNNTEHEPGSVIETFLTKKEASEHIKGVFSVAIKSGGKIVNGHSMATTNILAYEIREVYID